MQLRQILNRVGVIYGDRQRLERLTTERVGELVGQVELAERMLDPDLPDTGRAVEDQVLRRRDQLARPLAEVGIVGQPPEHEVRVEQDPHGSAPNAAAMSGGSSSKPS